MHTRSHTHTHTRHAHAQAVVTEFIAEGFRFNTVLSASPLEPYPGATLHGSVTCGPGDVMMAHVKQVCNGAAGKGGMPGCSTFRV